MSGEEPRDAEGRSLSPTETDKGTPLAPPLRVAALR